MPTYENRHFGLRIGIPDTWQITSCRDSTFTDSYKNSYQSRDDELPESDGGSLFLFTAALYAPDSSVKVDADVELSVFRQPEGSDLRKTILDNIERQMEFYRSNGIEQTITDQGIWTVNGVAWDYVAQESKSKYSHSWFRFAFRRIDPTLWLYAKIAGHHDWAIKQAIEVFQGLTWDAEKVA